MIFSRRSIVGIDVHGHHLRIVELNRGLRGFRIGAFGEIDLRPPEGGDGTVTREALVQKIRELARAKNLRIRHAVMALPRGRYFFRKVTLPPVSGEKLKPIIENQAERIFPFRGEQLVYDHQKTGRGRNGGRDVILAGAHHQDVEELMAVADSVGFDLVRVEAREIALCNLLRRPEKASGEPLILLHVDEEAVAIQLLGGGRPIASRWAPLDEASPDPGAVAAEIGRTMSFYNEMTAEEKSIDRLVLSGDSGRLAAALPDLQRASGGRLERISNSDVGIALPDGFDLDTLGHALGLALSGFHEGVHALDLLPRRIQQGRMRDEWMRTGGITLAIVLLAFGLLFVSVRRDEARLRAIEGEIASIEGRVGGARELEEEYESLVGRIEALNGLQEDNPRWLSILDDLSRSVPEDAWLTSLDMERGEPLKISGHAASAARLIPRLEASPWFRDVQFEAPTTKRNFGGEEVETFRITAEIDWSAGEPAEGDGDDGTAEP